MWGSQRQQVQTRDQDLLEPEAAPDTHLIPLFQLDIVQQEHIHQAGLQQFQVVRAAFDASGSWLATVEEREQEASEVELSLKLWRFDHQTQRYASSRHRLRLAFSLC